MDNSNNVQKPEQGLEFWENEVLYFDNALEGIRTSYAILSQMRANALLKVQEFVPEREEVSS